MIEALGIALVSLGIGSLFATWRMWVNRPRGSMITAEMAEFLRTPMYIHHARALARLHGLQEEDWPQFAHLAIAQVIYKVRF